MSKLLLASLLTPLLITSCGTLNAVKQTASKATLSVKQTASNATQSVKDFSLSDLRPSRIDVVEVRQKDLKEMPLGKDRALAYERKRDQSFWSFMLKDFKEPTLPDIEDAELDGSLLPPKS